MLRQLPNVLTSLRLGAIPVLVWLLWARAQDAFAALVFASLIGDMADGALARSLHAVTRLGAQLDSIADTLLFFITMTGVLVFYPEAVREHGAAFASVPLAWLAETVVALVRYGRLSSFHTYLSRVGAVAMGVFVAVLFLHGMQPILLYLAASVVLVATLEELVLLWLLPEWTSDVRGVYWVANLRPRV